jgi:hypothetical protein
VTIHVQRRVWRTNAGALVEDGHPDAAFLAYAPGALVPDLVAARDGLTAALAGDPARTVEVPPTAVVPAPTANLSGVTVVRDASVDGAAVVAPAPVIEDTRPTRVRKS